MTAIQTITPQRLDQLRQEQRLDLIDVRTPAEFETVHVPEARNVPLDQLTSQALSDLIAQQGERPLAVICHAGSRGAKACERLAEAGFASVYNVQGGTQAWEAAGLPVVRGRQVMSLERQVRIVAGFLAAVGGVLALTVAVEFAWIPVLIGSGLVFAGVTDTCGMGMLLAKMPWNRGTAPCAPGGQCATDEKRSSAA
jgi:rhodanese-related sulfurtransferase